MTEPFFGALLYEALDRLAVRHIGAVANMVARMSATCSETTTDLGIVWSRLHSTCLIEPSLVICTAAAPAVATSGYMAWFADPSV